MFGGGGGGGRSQPAPAPVERPKEEDPAVQKAQREALERKRRARGVRSTVLRNTLMSEETAKNLETLGS